MGALVSLFNITRGALAADQAALNVTGNNIANQNTAGYTRQIATFSAGDTVTLSGRVQVADSGPTVTVSSVRSRSLEQQLQGLAQQQASSGAQSDLLTQITGVFGITGSSATAGSTAIGTALDGLFSSFTALAADPADIATRQEVLAAAQTLTAAFNGAANQLSQVGAGLDAGLASSTVQVNALTATIAGLNQQIGSSATESAAGADAGALEDQRQQAITQLSSLIGLDQITTEQNGISLTTTGGVPLVSGSQAFALQAQTTTAGTQIEDASGAVVNAKIAGGSIGGQLAAQQTSLPQTLAALNALAYRVATAVNAQNAAGVDANGNTGGAIFAVPVAAGGSAALIAVTAAGPGAIAAAGVGQGSAGNTNANALSALANGTDAAGETIAGNLGALLSQVGSAASGFAQQSANQQATLSEVTSQVSQLSSVSLDEEAGNLTEYQQSYQAAAKVFSILNTILADAINLGEQTTVS